LLLCLLILVLILAGLILFVPIRYRISGSYLSDVPDGTAMAGWLFRMLQIVAAYHRTPPEGSPEGGFSVVIKVFGIPVRTLVGGEKEETKDEEPGDIEAVDIRPPEDDELPASVNVPPAEPMDLPVEAAELPSEEDIRPSDQTEQEGFTQRLTKRISDAWDSIRTTVKSLAQMVKQRTDGARKLAELWKAEENRSALKLLKKEALLLIHELLPRKGHGRVVLGTGEPYSTGQIMQAAAFLYPVYKDNIEVIPDFDNAVHDAEGDLKGSVRLAVVAWAVGRVFFDKRLRNLYRKTRSIIEKEIL
jgi:hypothetical protein